MSGKRTQAELRNQHPLEEVRNLSTSTACWEAFLVIATRLLRRQQNQRGPVYCPIRFTTRLRPRKV